MKRVDFAGPHDFQQTNGFMKVDRAGVFDTFKCSKCGMEGFRNGIMEPWIWVSDSYTENQRDYCTIDPLNDIYLGKQIKIKYCRIAIKFPEFANMKPGSLHYIIKPEQGYINGDRGVWVNGVGEKIKLLFEEFEYVDENSENPQLRRRTIPPVTRKRTIPPKTEPIIRRRTK